jgi:hypothetical protein
VSDILFWSHTVNVTVKLPVLLKVCDAVGPLTVVPSPKLIVLRTTGLPLLSWLAVPFAVTANGTVPEVGETLNTAVGG